MVLSNDLKAFRILFTGHQAKARRVAGSSYLHIFASLVAHLTSLLIQLQPGKMSRLIFSPLLLLLLLLTSVSPSSSQPDHFLKSTATSLRQQPPQQYLELTHPVPSDQLIPSCTLSLLQHSFANTMGQPPFSVPYSPPSYCPSPWSHVVLQIDATCHGDQYDRIFAIWLAGVEILRSSTAEPTASGIFWNVRKDVTRYSSLLSRSNLTLSMMLENLVNDEFTGVYHVNVSLFFYDHHAVVAPPRVNWMKMLGFQSDSDINVREDENREKSSLNLYETPADLIIPISDHGDEGFWFRIQNESDVRSKNIELPMNAKRVLLELYVSFHGNDEFWYSNPPNAYIESNNLTTKRGNGAWREVFVRIDGSLVATEIPFPVIFTGGINPLFWEPVVAIGAFDLPSYDFDLTPLLGSLLDGKSHNFELGVNGAIQFWLLDANLHIWLDYGSSDVEAKVVVNWFPEIHQSWETSFNQLDGSFKVKAERKSLASGWVASSCGNLTTSVSRKIEFKNKINFEGNGRYKMVHQKVKVKTEVRTVESGSGKLISQRMLKRKYPLNVITSTVPGYDMDTYMMTTNVSHSLKEKSSNGEFSGSLLNSQESGGWMIVKDHSVLSGASRTQQSFSYQDEIACYSRNIEASSGQLLRDESASVCPSFSYKMLKKLSSKMLKKLLLKS
ncbi:hypothetical protein Ancab_034515 [Ancistrocladus abbreviatus]